MEVPTFDGPSHFFFVTEAGQKEAQEAQEVA
jgi:hypothetical protein